MHSHPNSHSHSRSHSHSHSDKPDEALPLLNPESRTAALYEPQAPTKKSPTDGASEGLLGVEMQELKVVRRADTFRNPVDYREKTRTDMAP